MSTNSPATSIIPSISAIDSPRSITWVTPSFRGLALRSGRLSRSRIFCGRALLGEVATDGHHDRGGAGLAGRAGDRLGIRVDQLHPAPAQLQRGGDRERVRPVG